MRERREMAFVYLIAFILGIGCIGLLKIRLAWKILIGIGWFMFYWNVIA